MIRVSNNKEYKSLPVIFYISLVKDRFCSSIQELKKNPQQTQITL